jgi:WD40 repeat protein
VVERAHGTAARTGPPPGAATARAAGDLLQLWRHAAGVRASLSADGRRVLAAEPGGDLYVSSALDGSSIASTRPCEHRSRGASFDASGRRVLAACEQGCLFVWTPGGPGPGEGPIETAARVACLGGNGIELARFDPRGELVAACGAQDRVWIWGAEGGTPQRELAFEPKPGDTSGVVDLAFLPGREELAVACRDFRVRFWNPRTGEKTRADVFVSMVARLRAAPGGERLLLLGPFGGAAAKVLELATQQSIQADVPHAVDIEDGAFSPDGRLVLTVARDGSAHVWDALDSRPVAQRDLGTRLFCAAFDASGGPSRVLCTGEDGTISLWPVDPLPAARARRPRELSQLERERERRLALPLHYE